MKLVNPFIEGIIEVYPDLEVTRFNISEWEFNSCTGCGHCWFKKPGDCIFNDSFSENITKIIKSDLIIFSCPIWVGTGNHLFRNFTERLICTVKPDFELNGDVYGHKRLPSVKINKMILFSTCALPGLHNFTPIYEHYKSLGQLMDIEIENPIFKYQSLEMYSYNDNEKNELFKLCFKLGKSFAINNSVNYELTHQIATPANDIKEYIKMVDIRQAEIRRKATKS